MTMIKKNITLVIGISIPILMILFVAGSIYFPRLFIKPHFNFLYVSGDDSTIKMNAPHFPISFMVLVFSVFSGQLSRLAVGNQTKMCFGN